MPASDNVRILLAISLIGFFACVSKTAKIVNLPEEGGFFTELSEYALFAKKGEDLVANDMLIKYDIINALFTDYALKDRFIYMPEGKKAILGSDGIFDFPEGTILVKNFHYDETLVDKARTLETRLLIKEKDQWKAISYVWDDAMQKAKISKVGAVIPMSIQTPKGKNEKFNYVVPNKNQCKSCHNNNDKIDPLGFKYSNLNKGISVGGKTVNQIDYLIERGIIEIGSAQRDSLKTMSPYLDANIAIDERALAYLDVNCGHCHRPNGPGNTSGLFLQYNESRTNHLGICKAPVAAGKGSGGNKFDISPGRADSSILVFRISSTDPGVMMPEVGRAVNHEEGIEIIKAWINKMEMDCYAQ